MGPEEIDIWIILKRTLNSFSRNKGLSVSFILKYIAWDMIITTMIGILAGMFFLLSFFGVLEIFSNPLSGKVGDGPESGMCLLFLVFFFALIVAGIIGLAMFLITTPILYGGLVRVGDGFIDGKPVRFLDFWRLGKRDFWRTIGMVFLMGSISSIPIRIIEASISVLKHSLAPWDTVIAQPIYFFTSALMFMVIFTPLIIEERERLSFKDTVHATIKFFVRSWKVILSLVLLITVVVSPPIMVLQMIGILTIDSPVLSIPLSVMLIIGEMIFISIFMNHLIRSFPEFSRSGEDTGDAAG